MKINRQDPAAVHASALVIDTHVDTPQRLLDEHYDLAAALNGGNWNLATARAGNLGAQFFALWVEPARYQGQYARRTLELIDSVQQQVARHADQFLLATSAAGIQAARRQHKIAILLGIEGGHAIEGSLGLLRQFYALGARYMTLTWNNSNGWADSSNDLDDPAAPHAEGGLSEFGNEVIGEMNRLGMMVDVSHVSDQTFERVLGVSRAPVIATHSNARALCNAPRNLCDDMLRAVASKGGVVQVNFYSAFVSQEYREALLQMQPEVDAQVQTCKEKAAAEGRPIDYDEMERIRRAAADRIPRPPFSMVIDHIDHIAKVAGVDHVGIGSDFDGVNGQLPQGLDSPADLPRITAALLARGYSAADCRKILGGNFLRVFREVEALASSQK